MATTHSKLVVLAALVMVSLLAAACGGSPQDGEERDETIRTFANLDISTGTEDVADVLPLDASEGDRKQWCTQMLKEAEASSSSYFLDACSQFFNIPTTNLSPTTLEEGEIAPIATAVPDAPKPEGTPAPPLERVVVPGPPGYLSGMANGLALLRTSRTDSPGHPGWVDLVLDLAITHYGDDSSVRPTIGLEPGSTSLCFNNANAPTPPEDEEEGTVEQPRDCFHIAWGSEEQFLAKLASSQPSTRIWPAGQAWPLSIAFELPANASRASLVYGEFWVPLDVSGDDYAVLPQRPAVAAPVPLSNPGDPAGTKGYFIASTYGIALTGVSSEPHASLTYWKTAQANLSIMTFRNGTTFDLPLDLDTRPASTCLLDGERSECMRVQWGPQDEYEAVVALDFPSGQVPWPRSKGWPAVLSFPVPNHVNKATLLFGAHRILLDFRGMTGSTPAWDYQLHYGELVEGALLFAVEGKSIILSAIDHDAHTGDVLLFFTASNENEYSDFGPKVKLEAVRATRDGTFLDGDLSSRKWAAPFTEVRGPTLAPGQTSQFQLTLPRVVGGIFPLLAYSSDRPDAVVAQFTSTDAKRGTMEAVASYGYVALPRFGSERSFWFPDPPSRT